MSTLPRVQKPQDAQGRPINPSFHCDSLWIRGILNPTELPPEITVSCHIDACQPNNQIGTMLAIGACMSPLTCVMYHREMYALRLGDIGNRLQKYPQMTLTHVHDCMSKFALLI